MPVYPTRRSARFPQRIYDATREIAATAGLVDSGNGVSGAAIGIPFPIPSNGLEAIWNHLLRYRGTTVSCLRPFVVVERDGNYNLVITQVDADFRYHQPGMTAEALENTVFYFRQANLSPPRFAGGLVLIHETMNQVQEKRRTWAYNLGQRRVMRIPDFGYDSFGPVTDGLQSADQGDTCSEVLRIGTSGHC